MKYVVKISACVMAFVLLIGAFLFFNPVPDSDYEDAYEKLVEAEYQMRVLIPSEKNKIDVTTLTSKSTIVSQMLGALAADVLDDLDLNRGEVTLVAVKSKDFVVVTYAENSGEAQEIYKSLEVFLSKMREQATKLGLDFEFGIKGERLWFGTPQAIQDAK